ncbi:MAG: efflux RND transporter periplasmic adaptor subunit [Bacteroidota bacterium]|nr:efflux RND transporter periplasmic adaptor subunit [Bacteroidota bacterium]MDP4206092.1 efflux RND transporter periplasmic adaptor subunit [Bacteroidota bacterium]
MNKSHFIYLIPFLSLFLFSSSCVKDKKAEEDRVKSYEVETVSPQLATIKTEYPTVIQGQQNVEIRPRVEGYIVGMYVDEGAIVKKGQVLFQLDASTYQQEVRSALADIKVAQADVNTAKMQVNKVRPLVEKDIISHYELESTEYTLQSKQAVLAQAMAKLHNAKTNLSYTRITSPANGVIGMIPYKLGSLVSNNIAQPLTTVSNIGNVYAYFSMNEKQLLNFFKDKTDNNTLKQKLNKINDISLVLSDGTTYSYKGHIQTVSGLIDSQTGSANFRAVFANPQGMIHSGSSATLQIPKTISNALLVPQKSTYEIQGKHFVYVVDNGGHVHNTVIEINPNTVEQYYIVESGLNAGDKIVTDGIFSLKDGMHIKPKLIK